MITIRFDGKDHDFFQFGDLGIGDLFGANKSVYVKYSRDRYSFDAIDLRKKKFERFANEDIVEPIELEWEDGDGENDLE